MPFFTPPWRRAASVLALTALLLPGGTLLVGCGQDPAPSREVPRSEAPEVVSEAPETGPQAPRPDREKPTPAPEADEPAAAEPAPKPPTPEWMRLMGAGELESAEEALLLWRLEQGPGSTAFETPEILAALDAALLSKHTGLRLEGIRAYVIGLRDKDPGARRLEKVANKLTDPDMRVRAEAASVLHAVGRAAEGQAKALVAALDDPEEVVRVNASHALVRIKAPLAVTGPALRRVMAKDHSDEVRAHGALALGQVASQWDDATATDVIKALDDVHGEVRAAAIWAMTQAPARARKILPKIKSLAADETPDVRYAVEEAIRVLEGEADK